jgi:hypothetical protein
MAVVTRLRYHPKARDYVAKRTSEGLNKTEIIRCLKQDRCVGRSEDQGTLEQ